jgi:hypothetical protein
MNADERRRPVDGLGVAPHLDPARAPWWDDAQVSTVGFGEETQPSQ